MGLDRLVKREKGLSAEELRASRPLRNPAVETVLGDEDEALLIAPLEQQGRGLAAGIAKMMKMPATKKFELEPVGALVWSLCDGTRSFDTISKSLCERYKMNKVEADASLTAFLRMLGQRRLITLVPGKKK